VGMSYDILVEAQMKSLFIALLIRGIYNVEAMDALRFSTSLVIGQMIQNSKDISKPLSAPAMHLEYKPTVYVPFIQISFLHLCGQLHLVQNCPCELMCAALSSHIGGSYGTKWH